MDNCFDRSVAARGALQGEGGEEKVLQVQDVCIGFQQFEFAV